MLHALSRFITNFMYVCLIPVFRAITRYSKSNFVYHTYGSHFYVGRNLNNVLPLIEIEFEGYKLPAPGNFDGYLRDMFGDYMALPSNPHLHIKDDEIKIINNNCLVQNTNDICN